MPFITTNDGIKIHYEEKGRGDALLLIHAWSFSSYFFRGNMDELSKDYRVINMDLRGHGDSEKPAWGYRISRMAKDIKDLIEALNLKDVTLLGWSMGASIIWSYIDLFGNEHLAKIILVDQSPRQYITPKWKWGQLGCYDAEALAILSTRLEYDAEGVAREMVGTCLARKPTADEENTFVSEMIKCPGWVQAAIMADHTNLDWRDLLPQIKLPALVLVCRNSKVFPWQGSAYVGEKISKARTVFFEESSHIPFYEEADKFNQVVRDFMKRHITLSYE